MRDDNDATGDEHISAADEQALRAMFAALVQDAEPSGQSPLEIQRRAKAEQRSAIDRRVKRLRYTRNTLIAAVLAGVIALVLPHLGSSSSNSVAGASSSSSAPAAAPSGQFGASAAAGASAASAAAGAAAAPAGGSAAGEGSSAASSAAASGASSNSAAGAGAADGTGAASSAAGTSAAGSAAASGAMSSAAPAAPSEAAGSSAPASSGAAASSSSRGDCVPLPSRALAAVRAAMPGYGGTIQLASCTLQASVGPATGSATFAVDRSRRASCGASVAACPAPTGAGARIPGTTDAYAYPGGVVVTGPGGLVVTATAAAGGPNRQALIAGARALLKTLG